MSDIRTAAEEVLQAIDDVEQSLILSGVQIKPLFAAREKLRAAALAQPEPPVSVPSVEELTKLLADWRTKHGNLYPMDAARLVVERLSKSAPQPNPIEAEAAKQEAAGWEYRYDLLSRNLTRLVSPGGEWERYKDGIWERSNWIIGHGKISCLEALWLIYQWRPITDVGTLKADNGRLTAALAAANDQAAELRKQLAEQTGVVQQLKAENATLAAWQAENREKADAWPFAVDCISRCRGCCAGVRGHEEGYWLGGEFYACRTYEAAILAADRATKEKEPRAKPRGQTAKPQNDATDDDQWWERTNLPQMTVRYIHFANVASPGECYRDTGEPYPAANWQHRDMHTGFMGGTFRRLPGKPEAGAKAKRFGEPKVTPEPDDVTVTTETKEAYRTAINTLREHFGADWVGVAVKAHAVDSGSHDHTVILYEMKS
jgi:hypothetical protein